LAPFLINLTHVPNIAFDYSKRKVQVPAKKRLQIRPESVQNLDFF
jgi:hypothetical protein